MTETIGLAVREDVPTFCCGSTGPFGEATVAAPALASFKMYSDFARGRKTVRFPRRTDASRSISSFVCPRVFSDLAQTFPAHPKASEEGGGLLPSKANQTVGRELSDPKFA